MDSVVKQRDTGVRVAGQVHQGAFHYVDIGARGYSGPVSMGASALEHRWCMCAVPVCVCMGNRCVSVVSRWCRGGVSVVQMSSAGHSSIRIVCRH
jgi:hypothetical protein